MFDKREAISAGNVNGDGGVVRKDAASSGKATVEEKKKMLEWGAECAKCKKPWDRYIGKRKCYTCGVPVLVCDACMSQSSSTKKKKKKGVATAAGAVKEESNDKVRKGSPSLQKMSSGLIMAYGVAYEHHHFPRVAVKTVARRHQLTVQRSKARLRQLNQY